MHKSSIQSNWHKNMYSAQSLYKIPDLSEDKGQKKYIKAQSENQKRHFDPFLANKGKKREQSKSALRVKTRNGTLIQVNPSHEHTSWEIIIQ